MRLTVVCFPYSLTDSPDWRQSDYSAYKFVQALKGKLVKKWAWVPVLGKKNKLENENASDAFGWFADMVADYVANHQLAENLQEPFSVVPVPNSDSVGED